MRTKTKLIVASPWVFIPARELISLQGVPPGLYFRTSICVAQVACPNCKSKIGEPCRGKLRYYQVRPCHAREALAAGEDWPLSNMAKVEISFHGRKRRTQHDTVKICWPVKESTP